ncbi:hypothetical protein F0A17_13765 [Billgrantia pellis]|uniref:Uncharacterized protein n=1 Tax=Billgrantia pellis TaxID=2606936 RepID=A0A7V7FZ88_9GAMM|nr:hypothetical protein [Halomonas pellis]KAA0011187.1 hypothetical protein F0A17_13765 [Halomonas pellis]
MKAFWIPVIACILIWIAGGLFYWEIREGTRYQLDSAERVNAYLTLFLVASALTGSIFLIFQHWLMRLQLAQSNMPRLFIAVLPHRDNQLPGSIHRTGIKYINLTHNDFEDLEISLYGSVNNNKPEKFLRICKKKGFVQGKDERDINITTGELFKDIGINAERVMPDETQVRIQAKYSYTFMKKKITRHTPVYIFNFVSNTWDIDE